MRIGTWLPPDDERLPSGFAQAATQCADLGLPSFEVHLPIEPTCNVATICVHEKTAPVNLMQDVHHITNLVIEQVRFLARQDAGGT
jgi:hypothetical protein